MGALGPLRVEQALAVGRRGGSPRNPDYDAGKDEFRTYSPPDSRRTSTSRGSSASRRPSPTSARTTRTASRSTRFGFYGGTSLRGFRSGALRAEEAVTSKFAYGYVFGDAFRLEAIYEDARVKDLAAGLDWAYFAARASRASSPGPWSTIDPARLRHARRRARPRPDGRRPQPDVPEDLLSAGIRTQAARTIRPP